MADGHKNLRSISDDIFPNSLTDIDSIKANNGNYVSYNDLKENLMLCWTGDLVSLKQFIEASFDLNGKWKSPGDERKSYSDGETTITWWKNKKKLHFCGKDAKQLKQKCCDLLMGNEIIDDNNTRTNQDEHCHTNNSCIIISESTEAFGAAKTTTPAEKSALKIETINHCLCNQNLHDVNDIKLDIEILQSRIHALQSLANVQEGYSSIIDNSNKIGLLEQRCLEEREKLNKIELDLIDVKRILREMQEREQQQQQQQQQSIASLSSPEIPTSSLPNNENLSIYEADEAPPLSPTVIISAELNEEIQNNNSHDLLLLKNSQFENSSNIFLSNHNTGANHVQPTTQISFETQLNDYHEKQKLLFNRRRQKNFDVQSHEHRSKQRLLFYRNGQISFETQLRNFRARPKSRNKLLPIQRPNHCPHFYQIRKNPRRTPEWLDYLEKVRKVTQS